ncbi:MAG: hypothetical protein H0T76_05660 [Nannocystis sp.]|nr:hypothetical protein [Nannocystis sp.]MBA3545946.1 hypothetical protein [Nannocystis sp.]
MQPDLQDSRDPRDQLAAIERWKRRLYATRLLLAVLLLLAIASLVGATTTAGPRSLYPHLALWFFGQIAVIAATLLGLRALRRRRFGLVTGSRARPAGDVLLYIGSCVGGLLALLGFAPRILAGTAQGVDWAIAGLGLLLLGAGLRAAILYVLRP